MANVLPTCVAETHMTSRAGSLSSLLWYGLRVGKHRSAVFKGRPVDELPFCVGLCVADVECLRGLPVAVGERTEESVCLPFRELLVERTQEGGAALWAAELSSEPLAHVCGP